MRWVVFPPFSYMAEIMMSLKESILGIPSQRVTGRGKLDQPLAAWYATVLRRRPTAAARPGPLPGLPDARGQVVARPPAGQRRRLLDVGHPTGRLAGAQALDAVLRGQGAAGADREDRLDHVAHG